LKEEEAEKLMAESFAKDVSDYEEYPQSADILHRCVSILGRLFHAPLSEGAVGASVVGSFEAIMLSMMAMKIRWRNRMKAVCKPWDRPNIVMSAAAQEHWSTAARYLEIEEKYVYCTLDRYVIEPELAVSLVDENTIGICCVLGTPSTGDYEDVRSVNDLLVVNGIDVQIHVDGDSGGFVAPFILPDLRWDFRKLRMWPLPQNALLTVRCVRS
jgi:glutamate decarboxylase